MAIRQRAEILGEDDVAGAACRVEHHGVLKLARVVEVAQHAHDRRDAAPGADEQQLVRARLGQNEITLDAAQRDDRPGRPRRTRYGDTLPSSTFLTVMLMWPSSRRGSDVSEYARQWRTPSISSPIRRYWPGSVPAPPVAGLDHDGRRVGGFVGDLLDPPAELAGRLQRVDQLEVVVDEKRRGQRPEHPQGALLNRMNRRRCTFLGHLLISNIQMGSF